MRGIRFSLNQPSLTQRQRQICACFPALKDRARFSGPLRGRDNAGLSEVCAKRLKEAVIVAHIQIWN